MTEPIGRYIKEVKPKRDRLLEQLGQPRKGTTERIAGTKPSKKQRRLVKIIVDKSVENSKRIPDDAVDKSLKEITANAVKTIYSPTTSVPAVMASTGVQKLILETEKAGITDKRWAHRFAEGVLGDDLKASYYWSGLLARLKYPEAFRSNINVDNRKVTVYDQLTTEQLRELHSGSSGLQPPSSGASSNGDDK